MGTLDGGRGLVACALASSGLGVTAIVVDLARPGLMGLLGVGGREIQIPSTSTPPWIALTPKGMSLTLLWDSPALCISRIRCRFSSSNSSCFFIKLLLYASLMRPTHTTITIAAPSTCGIVHSSAGRPCCKQGSGETKGGPILPGSTYKSHLLP